ncbi:hypothetical protein [Anaeromicropila herbilytica]|uniref:Uncharacterized protein n=1 Tax=Anaeromicropila herbilytica TaxID=2785025 RepID=A0A7R7EIX3_9FIRM|nr:hypothetical protein [Anaeromicropila herbilytica]BCN29540.1 hypothetical protein bsdtb5_08350 [Anaeromicropila herbilytica]
MKDEIRNNSVSSKETILMLERLLKTDEEEFQKVRDIINKNGITYFIEQIEELEVTDDIKKKVISVRDIIEAFNKEKSQE